MPGRDRYFNYHANEPDTSRNNFVDFIFYKLEEVGKLLNIAVLFLEKLTLSVK